MIPYLRWGHVGEVLDDETVVLFWFHWPIVDHHVTVAMTTVAVVNLPIHCNRNSNYCNHSCAGDCYPQLHTVTHPKHTHTHKTKQNTFPTCYITEHFPHVPLLGHTILQKTGGFLSELCLNCLGLLSPSALSQRTTPILTLVSLKDVLSSTTTFIFQHHNYPIFCKWLRNKQATDIHEKIRTPVNVVGNVTQAFGSNYWIFMPSLPGWLYHFLSGPEVLGNKLYDWLTDY